MKSKKLLQALFACALLSPLQQASAQSLAHFYKENQSERTIASLPGTGEYISSETARTNDYGIHVSHYDAAGNLINSFLFDEPNVEDKNVDIVALNSSEYIIVSSQLYSGNNSMFVHLIHADIVGNVLQERMLISSHPVYNSLYAMDAVWDNNMQQLVICGTAIENLHDAPSDHKQAFVLTVDQGLSVLAMNYYDSPVFSYSPNDFDVANRIVLNSTGKYYITGSENVVKPFGGGWESMGIRNMLIDPNNLSIVWSVPQALSTDPGENSVDMAENQNGEFVTLVNFSAQQSWGILRIDPGSGNILMPDFEQAFTPGYAHNITLGNNPNELVVTGMQYRTQIPCSQYDWQADAFHTTLDLNAYPAAIIQNFEYLTSVGNNNGAIDYWTYGGFYATQNGYDVPMYLNTFATREAPNTDYGVLTPIFAPTNTELNTKFIYADVNGKTNCPMTTCQNGLDIFPYVYPYSYTVEDPLLPYDKYPNYKATAYPPYGKDECAAGYFKPSGITDINTLTAISVYPNPAMDVLNIQLPAGTQGAVTATLSDISGKKIADVYNGNAQENISYHIPANVTSGIYLLHITAGGTTRTERVSINK